MEVKNNQRFKEWLKKNTTILAAFTIIAGIDVEALPILSSEISGLEQFRAPISSKSHSLIFWCSWANFLIEDIPQFAIQVSHLKIIIN